MIVMRRSFVLTVAVLASGVLSSAHAQSYLASGDLEKALIGKTLGSTTKRGIAYTITFSSRSTGIYTMNGDKSDLNLTFSNDNVCFQSAKYKFSECNKVRVNGSKYDFVDTKTGAVNNVYDVK
jgi:hypothetical protein